MARDIKCVKTYNKRWTTRSYAHKNKFIHVLDIESHFSDTFLSRLVSPVMLVVEFWLDPPLQLHNPGALSLT